MGWFQRLFGGAGDDQPNPTWPIAVDLIPGKLIGRVYAHDFPDGTRKIPCWTYVTDGFRPLGQKEFVFTLVRGLNDNPASPPPDPLRFFAQVHHLAEQKQFVDVGGFTCFKPRADGFLGHKELIGFAYTRPQAIPGVETPAEDRCLTAVLLVPGEAEFVQAGGAYRVLTRLGRAATYYPHPPWSAPHRAPVLTPDEFRDSLIGKMPAAYMGGAFVRMAMRPTTVPEAGQHVEAGPIGDRVTLRIGRERLPKVQDLLAKMAAGAEGAFAWTFDADPGANVRLTWRPGDTSLNTITPATGDASRLTGGFLAVVYGPQIENSGRVVEDGFAVTLDPETWAKLRHALNSGEPVALPSPGADQIGLTVEWTD